MGNATLRSSIELQLKKEQDKTKTLSTQIASKDGLIHSLSADKEYLTAKLEHATNFVLGLLSEEQKKELLTKVDNV